MLPRLKFASFITAALLCLPTLLLPLPPTQLSAFAQATQDSKAKADELLEEGRRQAQTAEYQTALEILHQALAIYRKIKNPQGEASALNTIAITYYALGQYQEAIKHYQQTVVICLETGDKYCESKVLSDLGYAHLLLGQKQKAIELFQQGLTIARTIHAQDLESANLANLGDAYSRMEQYHQAIELQQQALRISREIGDQIGEIQPLAGLGNNHVALKQYRQAIEFFQKALLIQRQPNIGDRPGEADSLNNLGNAYTGLKQYQHAMGFYQQSLAIAKSIGYRQAEARTLSNIGNLLKTQNQPELAIAFYKQSVNTYEWIRKQLQVLPRDQQETFTQTVAPAYRQLANLLLQQDRILEAQQVLELLKIQELDNYLRNVRGNPGDLIILRSEEEILKRYNKLQETAIQVGKELAELRKLQAKNALTPVQEKLLGQLIELEVQINRQFNQFIESEPIQTLIEQLSRTARNQNLNLEDLNALRDNLKKLDAVLLYPLILEDRLELVITTPDAPPIRRTVNNLKREDLNRVIADFRSALQNPRSNVEAPAQQLYQWLIKPIAADLQQAKPKTIIYAPDGQLRYIPLAALYDGKDWLVQRYRINNITARSVTDFTVPLQKRLRIFAGAFGLQPHTIQVGTHQFSFAGLPFTVKEVEALTRLVPDTSSLIAQSFSRTETLKQLGSFNVIHLATHGKFVVGQAENSFIALGNGDYIPLPEIKDLSLTNVDLIVLSACETGIGDKLGNGEEILGLGYQFQRAGAKAVIASLWQVDDGGTQALMNAFYTALKGGMTKAQALQEAQNALITDNYSTIGGNRADIAIVDASTGQSRTISSETLQHPYYWAPFILIGNGL